MGVAGLWDILRPAAKTRSLTDIAITDGFEANPEGKRGYRIGVDVSIWFFHAAYGTGDDNSVLQILFFRCAALMRNTFLPIFVFDGPERPEVKRGKKINRASHKLTPNMKQIIEAFGFEWRLAPGEAEAELAYLNRIGVIEGILSDDVDNFLFGATTVLRNASNTLSGNRSDPVLNSTGKDDKNHTRLFQLQDIQEHPEIRLSRGGMILIGLMSGGDYQKGGVARCGTTISHGLSKCGFGDSLYNAVINLSHQQLKEFLVAWRNGLREELRTNSKRELGRRQVALANSIPEDFPDIDILLSYVNPITSETIALENRTANPTWSKEPDLAKLAALSELYFRWGHKEAIIKRFRTVMWRSIVLRVLRRAVLDLDGKSGSTVSSTLTKKNNDYGTLFKTIGQDHTLPTPTTVVIAGSVEQEGEKLIVKIHSSRIHTSTGGLLEYRLEIAPRQLVKIAESGIQGTRAPRDADGWASENGNEECDIEERDQGQLTDPGTHIRMWMPACMVKLAEPHLVQKFERIRKQKNLKAVSKGVRSGAKSTNTRKKVGARR